MQHVERAEIPLLPVRQWLAAWDDVRFDEAQHRRRPPELFYVASMKASMLRALCDVRRRSVDGEGSRQNDLNIQRRHNEARSLEIAEFVQHGFPWSALSVGDRKSGKYQDLKKPGWLPTAIVVNVLAAGDIRENGAVASEDLVEVTAHDGSHRMSVPSTSPDWVPKKTAPIEVIDGQHRLWAFDGSESDFELPVVIFHGLDISWQAYLFYVINIKPAKINTSLGFDLYPLLRTEDWLEHAGGPTIYRESRAQELTEALWSFPESPWYRRIDMLGDGGRRQVSQAAWIKTLLSTFVKKWESTRSPIGGLYGAPAGEDAAVLPWNRAQQSAFLIEAWIQFAEALSGARHEWAQSLRDAQPGESADPAFDGPTTLPNTDQGVRAFLAVVNDMVFVLSDELKLREWPPGDFFEGTSEIGIRESLRTLRALPVAAFLRDIAEALASYDWRTYGAPDLPEVTRSAKARFRGSTGYRELRQDVLSHLAQAKDSRVSETAKLVLEELGWELR